MSAFLKQFLFIFHKNELFWIKLILIKMKNYQQFKKNADNPLHSSFLWNPVQKFKANAQAVLVLALREHRNLILTYFTSSSPSKFSWRSSSHLARSKCSFYLCYIFSLVIIFTKKINTEGRTRFSIAIGEKEYSQDDTLCWSLLLIKLDFQPWT